MLLRLYPAVILLICASIFEASCEDKGSLTFVIDTTLSMTDDINQVKRSTEEITKIVFEEKSSHIKNMVLVAFNDPHAELVTVTENRNELKNKINAVQVHNRYNNRDCPEMALTGLSLALQRSLPGSYIYVFTDASAKDAHLSGEIKNMCQKKQTQIVFVLSGYCYGLNEPAFRVYYDIATACSGLAFHVNKNNVHNILSTIKETISGNKNSLIGSRTVPARTITKIPFIIDDQTEYAIVTVSGEGVRLEISGPKAGQQKLMWIDSAKSIKLIKPTPGTYTATVYGETETSVYIVGKTDFTFNHGFSELEPKTLKDTRPQPIANAKTHLSVAVDDPKQTVKIESALIMDMNEKVLQTLPLKKLNNNFYTTPLFQAPSQRFKVAVIGTAVSNGDKIKRIAKIPITPQEPPKIVPKPKTPVLTVDKPTVVEAGKTIKLTCKVSAYPAPTIKWINKRGETLKSQSSAVELPYDYISYLTITGIVKSDTYKCVATNNVGSSSQDVQVTVKDLFAIKTPIKGVTELPYGKKGTLKCDITAKLPMRITWFIVNPSTGTRQQLSSSDKYSISSDGTQLTFNKVELNAAGVYSCRASLINDNNVWVEYKTQVKVTGPVPVKPTVVGVNNMKITKGFPIVIVCSITGVPKPTVTWQFMGKTSSKYVTIPKQSENTLRITRVEDKHAGRYKCIAQNTVGTSEHVTTLNVESAPVITTKPKTIYGLVGDVALRIPCDAQGVPRPFITWKRNGVVITSNDHYVISNGALIINSPKKTDTTSYTCVAKNSLGTAESTFKVIIDDRLNDYGKTRNVNVAKGQTVKINCGADGQLVRWYKDKKDLGVTTKYIELKNMDASKEGHYSCRVSDKNGSHTETIVIQIGFPPEFVDKQVDPLVDWTGSPNEVLNCDVKGKTGVNVVWTYNGKVLKNEKSTRLVITDKWGRYTCTISNGLGKIQRDFDVVSSSCLIPRQTKNKGSMPLILTSKLTWPALDATKNYLRVGTGQTLTFICPDNNRQKNKFRNIPNMNVIKATCDKQDTFIANGKPVKVSDLECFNELKPVVVSKGQCLGKDSRLLQVGFNVPSFLKAYEVCFDTSKNIPLYTRVAMSKSNLGPGITGNWYKYPGLGDDKARKPYSCPTPTSSCCYSKTQLVKARDVSDGPAQVATFIDHINAVPYWHPCNSKTSPWEEIEDVVRSRLQVYPQFVAWSGTHTLQNNNGAVVPRYLWKVVRFNDASSIAIVYVNGVSPTNADILCKNICPERTVPWINTHNKPIYCCNLDDFRKAFGYGGTPVGDPLQSTEKDC
ncbi:hemicentin-2-like [Anticarsia gemmatalis]|uniref:hemicentin-2-like n=1 Tax=Anticarsia gemmatalis TaxID=129554 RepID=UPI003F763F53